LAEACSEEAATLSRERLSHLGGLGQCLCRCFELGRCRRDGLDDVAHRRFERCSELVHLGLALRRGTRLVLLLLGLELGAAHEVSAEAFRRARHYSDLIAAFGAGDYDVVVAVAHLLHGVGKLGQELAQHAHDNLAQAQHGHEHQESDGDIKYEMAPGGGNHLLCFGADQVGRSRHNLGQDSGHFAVQLEPALYLIL
jgi:hypothetical protein